MTLREQVEEAWPVSLFASTRELVTRQAVLDLIDAHRCLDPERLARALEHMDIIDYTTELHGYTYNTPDEAAAAIIAAYEEQE